MPPLPLSQLENYFGDYYPKMAQFASLLVGPGIERGLIGPREADRIWERHLVNCAGVCTVLPTTGTLLDLGSGAGLPGIVIAIMRPAQQILLLESLLRRTIWLEEVATTLDLPNVTVVRGRAGETLKLPDVAAVTARAVAPLSKLLNWSAPILKPGGALYAIKGEGVTAEIEEVSEGHTAKKYAKDWKLPPKIVESETIPTITPTTTVITTRK